LLLTAFPKEADAAPVSQAEPSTSHEEKGQG
jgi:hypothetical protein